MKIALVYGGQPRFTQEFVDLMNRLKGFDTADIYMVLWKTDWAETDEKAYSRIQKVLLPQYKIAKIKIVDEPNLEFPPGGETLDPPTPYNTAWWYNRVFKQAMGVSLAIDLVDKEYDMLVRFRGDGTPTKEIDLSQIDLNATPLLLPSNARAGFPDFAINDQFAIGTQEMVKKYLEYGKYVKQLIPESDPDWNESNVLNATKWTWGTEHIIGYYMKKHGMPLHLGNYEVIMNSYGRSKYTDKHFHHGIAPDPTN